MAIVKDLSGNNPTDDHKTPPKFVYKPLKVEQLSVGATAVSLNPPGNANIAEIIVEGVNIRYRDDNTDPTAAVGMLVGAGTGGFPYSGDLTKFRMISTGGTATVDVAYYG